jgi:hypothetical protein
MSHATVSQLDLHCLFPPPAHPPPTHKTPEDRVDIPMAGRAEKPVAGCAENPMAAPRKSPSPTEKPRRSLPPSSPPLAPISLDGAACGGECELHFGRGALSNESYSRVEIQTPELWITVYVYYDIYMIHKIYIILYYT